MTPRSLSIPVGGPARERGAVLVVGLVLLLVLTLAGVVLARMQTVEERMARNEDNHQLALQAAEGTLRSVELALQVNFYTAFSSNTAGQYTLNPATGGVADALVASNWSNPAYPYLTYAGPALAAVPLSQPPVFVIEQLPAVATSGQSLTQKGALPMYRIAAHGFGGDSSATVTLESIVK
jgi:type IV pilus assembly protein PilX